MRLRGLNKFLVQFVERWLQFGVETVLLGRPGGQRSVGILISLWNAELPVGPTSLLQINLSDAVVLIQQTTN